MSRLYTIFLFFFISLLSPALSEGQAISGPDVKIADDDIYVTFSVSLKDKNIQEVKQGIEKELKFYIDLFRVWKVWPDEFVLGNYYSRTLKSDPIKKEHIATSDDGNIIVKKRFRSFDSMLDWTLSVKNMKLANTRELDTGQYFVKITIESKIRKFPPVIGYLFIFLPENEFKIVKDSSFFTVEGNR
jgi:hypothetical protein